MRNYVRCYDVDLMEVDRHNDESPMMSDLYVQGKTKAFGVAMKIREVLLGLGLPTEIKYQELCLAEINPSDLVMQYALTALSGARRLRGVCSSGTLSHDATYAHTKMYFTCVLGQSIMLREADPLIATIMQRVGGMLVRLSETVLPTNKVDYSCSQEQTELFKQCYPVKVRQPVKEITSRYFRREAIKGKLIMTSEPGQRISGRIYRGCTGTFRHITVCDDGSIVIEPKAFVDDIVAFLSGAIETNPTIDPVIKSQLRHFVHLMDARAVQKHGYSHSPNEAALNFLTWYDE